jgi:hypothetical protein
LHEVAPLTPLHEALGLALTAIMALQGFFAIPAIFCPN